MLLRGLCDAQALLQKLASLRKGLQLTGVLRQVQRQLARPRATPVPQSRRAAAETARGPARQCSSGQQISKHGKKQAAEDRRKVGRFCNGRSGGPALPAKSKRPQSACSPGHSSAGAACATPRQRGKRGEWACRSINQTRPAYCLMWTDCFKSGLN